MSGDTKKKEELATEMVQIIMKLRMYGLVENSPISLNELQFLRSENTRLKEEKKVLEEKVKHLSTALVSIPTEDAKIGVK